MVEEILGDDDPLSEKEKLLRIITQLDEIRISAEHSDGQGFIYNAQRNIYIYLNKYLN